MVQSGVLTVTGEYKHSLDSKGRIFIPARLREELGEVFYITLSMDKCLNVYSSESWQALSDRVSAMPYINQRKMRPLFANAARCELDAQGRVLLPVNIRSRILKEDRDVEITGANDHVRVVAEKVSDSGWESFTNELPALLEMIAGLENHTG